jgi:tetratricopeptide (TPR) repeat protein/peroxiredoxin
MFTASLRGITFSSSPSLDSSGDLFPEPGFRFHPRYLTQRPLDSLLLKTNASLDDFPSEKHHDKIAAVLAEWSSALLRSPKDVQAVGRTLAPDFAGCSPIPSGVRVLRSETPLEIKQNQFAVAMSLTRADFLRELQKSLDAYTQIDTAEFQVINISVSPTLNSDPPEAIRTRVRYEFVGTGHGFQREQRVGHWDLEWESSSTSNSFEFKLRHWQILDETRSRSSSPVFVDIASSALGANASYSAQLSKGVDHWRTVLDGASGIDVYGHNGVSIADIDNDGYDDLYVCQPAGLPNRLYRNRRDGTFEDITESSGLGLLDNTACALFADFNNNGRQDVVIVTTRGPLLFLNQGDGKFLRRSGAFQFVTAPAGTFTGAAVADYDCDGWLDIYFCLYAYYQGTDQYRYPVPYHDAENGPPNFMMRNQRDGTFRDVTAESGLTKNNTRYSFCCGWSDYNQDGWPDLYVVNDFGRKNLYRNNCNGTFTDVASDQGVEDVGAGMSVCWADFDNDSNEDLYVGDMWTAAGERISSQETFKKDISESVRALYRKHAMGNSLFRKTKNTFSDQTVGSGAAMGRWAWSSDSFDFDHDGFADLYIANGMISGRSREDLNSFFWRQVAANSPDSAKSSSAYEQGWNAINELIRADGTWSGFERNVFYANNRDGTFSDVSGAVGLDFVEDGRAFALADFDHDGRQDIFLKNRNAPQLRVLKNTIENLPPSIIFRLRGTKSNRDAIGAAITLQTEAGRQTRMLQAGSGFLSQHSKEIFFGLGDSKGTVNASIRWPSGLTQQFSNLAPNHRIFVEEGSEEVRSEPFKATSPTVQPSLDTLPTIEPLPRAVENWLLIPFAAPEFSLPDFSGAVHTLSTYRGKIVLLNLSSTQSSESKRELKRFQQEYIPWKDRGLQLLSVNLDEAKAGEVRKLARELGLTFPVLRASDEIAAVYNIVYRYVFDRHRDLTLPTSFLIDQEGNIIKIYQGEFNVAHVDEDIRNIPRSTSERLARALPFLGVAESFEFGRNYLSPGSIFFQRGYFDQAAASFELALHDDPSSAEALYGLGSAFLSQQKTAEARLNFERAVKLLASYPDTISNAWNNLGLIATRENRTDEAIRCFQQALQSNPDHLIALNNLGSAYRLEKDWPNARKTFEHALTISSDDADANYGLAMVFAQADDPSRAKEYLDRALKARPAFPEALNNLGILFLRTQRRDQAVAAFEECIQVAPDFDQSYLNLARVYTLENMPEKARTVLLALLKRHPGHAQAQSMLDQLPH